MSGPIVDVTAHQAALSVVMRRRGPSPALNQYGGGFTPDAVAYHAAVDADLSRLDWPAIHAAANKARDALGPEPIYCWREWKKDRETAADRAVRALLGAS